MNINHPFICLSTLLFFVPLPKSGKSGRIGELTLEKGKVMKEQGRKSQLGMNKEAEKQRRPRQREIRIETMRKEEQGKHSERRNISERREWKEESPVESR